MPKINNVLLSDKSRAEGNHETVLRQPHRRHVSADHIQKSDRKCLFTTWDCSLLGVSVIPFTALLIAALKAGALGLDRYTADVFAIGMAMNTLIFALTKLLLNELLDASGNFYSSELVQLPRINLAGAGASAASFGNFALMDVCSWLLTAAMWRLIYKTVWGLRLRSVGCFPQAAISAGLKADRIQMCAVVLSGAIGGLAGAHLSLGYSAMFVENMVNGRGFMGVAAMLFGGGNPLCTLIGCLLFGAADSLGARLQTRGLPSQFMQAIPYIATVVVLTAAAARSKLARRRTARRESSRAE